MPLAEKGVRGKGRQPSSPPQHTVSRSASSAPVRLIGDRCHDVSTYDERAPVVFQSCG
jgi:hypothetical protein